MNVRNVNIYLHRGGGGGGGGGYRGDRGGGFVRSSVSSPNQATYVVEYAKTGRSLCNATGLAREHEGEAIRKNEIRVGRWDGGRRVYCHLRCWRIPVRIWLHFPNAHLGPIRKRQNETTRDEVLEISDSEGDGIWAALLKIDERLFRGFDDLESEDQVKVIDHCFNRKNWAEVTVNSERGVRNMTDEFMRSVNESLRGGNQTPAEKYATQLRKLREMGFAVRHREDELIRVLVQTAGDVNMAISILFS